MSIFALEASALLGQISAGQLSADSSSTETLYCLNRVRPKAKTQLLGFS